VSTSLQFFKIPYVIPNLNKRDVAATKASVEELKDETTRKELTFMFSSKVDREDIAVPGVNPGKTCLFTVVLIDRHRKWYK